ncbi:hypothetical protein FACS189421_06720 [Bacteroidia bacterium]|nr:hypothetical protein FACS189421_06720 [Bacteroidia bacterium]
MKIDLVYMWVDGNDPVWRAKKNAALAAVGRPLPRISGGDNRWRDNDELKYALRSAVKFAPWINNIFIITDGQRPKWLADNPRVKIVDHKDIIPKKYLPVFNSTAIELFIQNIPGLSEHFLFSNDDMFFGAPVTPDFFFDKNGNPIVIVQERMLRPLYRKNYKKYLAGFGMFFNMVKNGNRFVFDKFGKKYHVTMTHAIEPMCKSYLQQNISEFEKEFMESSATRFRENSNIQRLVYPLMDNARGRNSLVLKWGLGRRRIQHDPEHTSFARQIWREIASVFTSLIGIKRQDSCDRGGERRLRNMKPRMFCIGDNGGDQSKFDKNLKFMQEMFPEKSEFEK